jgi:hypothetical protein
MVADYKRLSDVLGRFYDFSGKRVLAVGAGSRLLDLAIPMKELIILDRDADALDQVRAGLDGSRPVELVNGRFEEFSRRADVVYMEFCLHEMADPDGALAHGKALARDVVVFDHRPESEWVFLAAEEGDVARGARAIDEGGARFRQSLIAHQHFQSHGELVEKLASRGALAQDRAQRYRGAKNIVIPMTCELALL